MRSFTKRAVSLALALMLCVGLLSGISFPASAATVDYVYGTPTEISKYTNVIYNWGTRGEVVTFLSPNAEAFYTEQNVTYSELSELSGSSSTASVPSSALYVALNDLVTNAQTKITGYDDTRYLYQFTDCQGSALTDDSISCFYSGTALGPEWDSGSTWNREHTWPNSKGDANGNGENDIMMLRPTSTNINSSRGNKAYGTETTTQYYNPNNEANGNYDVRGDVARTILYVYTRWGTENMWGADGVIESKEVLLQWMEEDPVDTWEMGRNDSVESITGTRNVYVDYPELAFLLFNEEVPVGMTTPSGGNDVVVTPPSYTVTAVSGNASYGTVSVTDNVITATPAADCYVSGYTVISGTATVVRDGNVFTVTPASDCTVRINFEANPVEPGDVVQVMAHNVLFDDYLQIMYAVYVPDGQTINKIVLSDGVREYSAIPYINKEGNVETLTIKEKACTAYVADTGVSLQNIDKPVTAEIYVGDDVVATDEYSVLQYLHKRLTVDDLSAVPDKQAMYEKLLYAAEKTQVVINGGVTLYNSSYVYVENGTVDGRAEAMVAVGTTLEAVTSTLVPGATQQVVWTVTAYTDGVAGAPVAMTTEQVRQIVVQENVNIVLQAALDGEATPAGGYVQVTDIASLTSGQYIIAVNNSGTWKALGNTFGSKITGGALSVTDGVVQNTNTDELTLTVTVAGANVTLSNGTKYLGYGASGTNFTQPAEAYNWTVAAGTTEGTFTLTATTGTNRGVGYQIEGDQFGGYSTTNKTGYIFELYLFKLSGTVVEPDPTDPTEPEETVPTEPEETTPSVVETTVEMAIYATNGTLASDSSSISWTVDGVTFTGNKGGTAIRTSDTDHFRCYQNGALKISAPGKLSKIVMTITENKYVSVMQTALEKAGCTVVANGLELTITPPSGVNEFTFTPTAQTRLSKIVVTYTN